MDTLYTSFLQKLLQASDSIQAREEIQEKDLLKLLGFLSLKIKEGEAFIKTA